MSTKEQRHQYYLNNIEHVKRKAREWHKNNQERAKERSKKYRESTIQSSLWRAAKQRCEQNNLEFTIEISDITIPEKCKYLNITLNLELGKGKSMLARKYSPSLDRIDNSKGYIKGNTQVISWLANTMKSASTKEELLIFAKNVILLEESIYDN